MASGAESGVEVSRVRKRRSVRATLLPSHVHGIRAVEHEEAVQRQVVRRGRGWWCGDRGRWLMGQKAQGH
jgi:hypothetical protein